MRRGYSSSDRRATDLRTPTGATREAERFAEWRSMNTGMEVHWYFAGSGYLCDEYAMGDAVIDHDKSAVTCQECLEWMHA